MSKAVPSLRLFLILAAVYCLIYSSALSHGVNAAKVVTAGPETNNQRRSGTLDTSLATGRWHISKASFAIAPQRMRGRDALPTCKEQAEERPELSGTVKGVFYPSKGAKGMPATLEVSGKRFKLTYESQTIEGSITAFNKCRVTYLSLKFDDPNLEAVKEAGTSVASLQVREVGSITRLSIDDFETKKPLILETVRESNGEAAGPDVAFVVCPPHPDCLDWPSCTCNP